MAATFTPLILVLPGMKVLTLHTQFLFHLLSLCGIVSYLVDAPNQRLMIGGVALALTFTLMTATWFQSSERRHRAIATYLLGLLLSLAIRVLGKSTNPLWPIMNDKNGGLQIPGLILAVACILDLLFRSSPQLGPSPKECKSSWGGGLAGGLGLGAALFCIHWLFTDTITLSRFIWTGYPNHGPVPFPDGLAVIVALALGLVLSTQSSIATHPIWWSLAAGGSALLYYSETWMAFAGGLVLAAYVMSVTPWFISSISKHSPIYSLAIAIFVYNMLLFGSVWVVAYAFVPYGEYMREHTEYLIGLMMFFMLIGTMGGDGEGLFEYESSKSKEDQKASTQFGAQEFSRLLVVLGLIAVVTVAAASTRFPVHPPVHSIRGAPNQKIVTGGIWTIHFGYDNQMWASHDRMAALINDSSVDFVGLLESDTNRPFIGNRDVPMMVAEKLGMYLDYGPRSRDHTWGCALLSKFPISWSKHYLLPSPEGELACAIHATLNVGGTPLDVLVVHNGQEETPLDRELQTKMEASIMKNATNPLIFLGYVVTKPHHQQYQWLLSGGAKDIDPTDHDRWCEYIVYKGVEKLAYARVSHGGITDTEMQIGRFRLNTNTDNTDEIPERDVEDVVKMPSIFNGQGVRGHRYHVFNKPKYFGKKKTTA